MDERTRGESPHELLLALAGRIDDDLLAWCRELVAVGEDSRAVELIAATLVADRTALPARERAAVVGAARAARSVVDLDAALPAAVPEYGTAHRFDPARSDVLAAAVRAVPARQVAGCRTWVTSRITPAGAAPGPLPQPVVLVELEAGDTRPPDVLAYQIAIACARAGAAAAVEVVVAGIVPPEYQQAALRTARPVHDGTATGRMEPAVTGIGSAERTEPAGVPVTPLRGASIAPEPEPIRPGRDRRDSAVPDRARLDRARPVPVPTDRRNGWSPSVPAEEPEAERAPSPAPDAPAPAPSGDPLVASTGSTSRRGASIDEADPLGLGHLPLPPDDRAPTTPDPDEWLADWITGEWAMPPTTPHSPEDDRAVPPPPDVEIDRVDPPPPRPARRAAPEPSEQPGGAGFGLRPDPVARLTDADRELLARLQSDLGDQPRPRVSRRAGIAGTNGDAPDPPDIAG